MKRAVLYIGLGLLLCASPCVATQLTRYVDSDLTTGNEDGTSWTDAFHSLRDWHDWEVASGTTDLTTAEDNIVVYCRGGQDVLSGNLPINGDNYTTTNGSYDITIIVPMEDRHDGTRDTGYRISYTGYAFSLGGAAVNIVGLAFDETSMAYFGVSNYREINFKHCLIYDAGTITYHNCTGTGDIVYNGCIALSCSEYYIKKEYNVPVFLNCTSMACSNGFSVESGYDIICKNCYAGGSSGSDYNAAGTITATNCYSEDGTNSTTTVAYSTTSGAYFANVTAGSEDPKISSSSDLVDAGSDLSADGYWYGDYEDFEEDARGTDVGADEYAAATGNKAQIF